MLLRIKVSPCPSTLSFEAEKFSEWENFQYHRTRLQGPKILIGQDEAETLLKGPPLQVNNWTLDSRDSWSLIKHLPLPHNFLGGKVKMCRRIQFVSSVISTLVRNSPEKLLWSLPFCLPEMRQSSSGHQQTCSPYLENAGILKVWVFETPVRLETQSSAALC